MRQKKVCIVLKCDVAEIRVTLECGLREGTNAIEDCQLEIARAFECGIRNHRRIFESRCQELRTIPEVRPVEISRGLKLCFLE